ncbi:hypothetical protein R1sor_024460 [Riccia sorocarpa]|uniref:Uncharacterized protein n=1 Tax=Riccia sorocarpa TaxID=122646 RepID=A0ABD3GUJ0_9MARC
MSQALKVKYIVRLLSGENGEWAWMIKFFIKCEMKNRAQGSPFRAWSAEEVLLLAPSIQSPSSPTLRHLLKDWPKGNSKKVRVDDGVKMRRAGLDEYSQQANQ